MVAFSRLKEPLFTLLLIGIPPYPIHVAIVSETGYSRGGEVYGGSWSGVINAPDTGKNYFAISHNNYGVVITYSGEVIWP